MSQVDGQKPVSGNLEVQYMETGDKEEAINDFKGDVSAQIMEVHGSRVKKYGIFLEQIVDKIKIIQQCAQDLFDLISM